MPFPRPTLSELITRVTTDVSSQILDSGLVLARSVVGVLVRVFAGIVHTLHDHVSFAIQQTLPDTATDEFLDRHAGIYLSVGRLPASPAVGTVRFTGVDTTIVPAGTQINRSDGQSYTTDANGTMGISTTGLVDIPVTAETAGSAANTAEGVEFTLSSVIVDIDNISTALVDGVSGGADTESDDSLRERILSAITFTPQGGSIQDYETWASEISDVDQVWVYANGDAYGLGTVKVQFSTFSGTEIPGAPKVLEVQNYIDVKRPVTATVTVEAPIPQTAVIQMAITPDTSANRVAVTAEIEDYIYRSREPGVPVTLSSIQIAALSAGVTTAVVIAPGADLDPGADGLYNLVNVSY